MAQITGNFRGRQIYRNGNAGILATILFGLFFVLAAALWLTMVGTIIYILIYVATHLGVIFHALSTLG